MIEICGKTMIGVEIVYDTKLQTTDEICKNLGLIKKRYKEIDDVTTSDLHIIDIEILHDRIGKNSYSSKEGSILKDIESGEMYFIGEELLKDRETCVRIYDNINDLQKTLSRELYINLP